MNFVHGRRGGKLEAVCIRDVCLPALISFSESQKGLEHPAGR